MPQFFSTERVKARSISTFCWMCFVRLSSRSSSRGCLGEPWGVEAEVDADVAVLFKVASSNSGPKPRILTVEGLGLPERVETDGSKSG